MSDNQTTTRDVKVTYDGVKEYNNLVKEYQHLLTKVDSISKLLEQIYTLLLSYNPNVAKQVKKELEKINEQNDDKDSEPRSNTPG
tara:strand:- start:293 stop:547 length:255 start_codon:yes stop_codon:yes gene_type:complete